MHVSSTEPRAFHTLGDLSTLPEKYGCDFLWFQRGWCGVQRKEVKDFMASVRDGRLARELAQMEPLRAKMLVLEGTYNIVAENVVVGRHTMSVQQWMSALWVMQTKGVILQYTPATNHTRAIIKFFEQWTAREEHGALGSTRDAVPRSKWGTRDSRDYQIHLLTGLPGVGEELAGRLIDHFDGVPWRWQCTEEELCQVPGIGKTRAQRMIAALGS